MILMLAIGALTILSKVGNLPCLIGKQDMLPHTPQFHLICVAKNMRLELVRSCTQLQSDQPILSHALLDNFFLQNLST